MTTKYKLPKQPMVSICTPTFNRRHFIPIIVQCVMNQTYPLSLVEWIIVDDGTDKIGDLVSHIPFVRYFPLDEKLTLGKKRNLTNSYAKGHVLVYMDDDDYYPPDRIQHVVDTLRANPRVLCVGSSVMHMYFKHIHKMYRFGPYGPNHTTAATMGFRKELLKLTSFDETNAVAEERHFLKGYTIPFAQLDTMKSILVFSHDHNSFDKKRLLEQAPNPFVHDSDLTPADFIKEPAVLQFFMHDIDTLLAGYEPGKPSNKPDVETNLVTLEKQRVATEKEQRDFRDVMGKVALLSQPKQATAAAPSAAIEEMTATIETLRAENAKLREKNEHLNLTFAKMRDIIANLRAQNQKKEAV